MVNIELKNKLAINVNNRNYITVKFTLYIIFTHIFCFHLIVGNNEILFY